MLIRWRGLSDSSYIVTPFIGFPKEKSDKRIALWQWFSKFNDKSKLKIYTRPSTRGQRDVALKKLGYDVEKIKEYKIPNAAIPEICEKNNFHSKFYGANMGRNFEVLTGSYNIHESSGLENFDFREIRLDIFKERYLEPLGIFHQDQLYQNQKIACFDFRTDNNNFPQEADYGFELISLL